MLNKEIVDDIYSGPSNFEASIEKRVRAFQLGHISGYIKCLEKIKSYIRFPESYSTSGNNTSIEQDNEYNLNIMEIINDTIYSCLIGDDCLIKYINSSLQKYYNLKNSDEIYNYLKEKPKSFNFLIDAAKELKNIFGESITFTLVKKRDPEDFNFEYISIFINTSHLPIKEARKLLKKFKFNWYFDKIEDIDGRFVFHVT